MQPFVEVDASSVKVVVRRINRFARKSSNGVEQLTDIYAGKLRREVVKNASGRPGPRKVTGEYVRSIRVVKKSEGFFNRVHSTSVETQHPAGPRLEYGFVGVDSLGRHYNQPPYPHWRPAVQALKPKYPKAAMKEVRRWMKNAP